MPNERGTYIYGALEEAIGAFGPLPADPASGGSARSCCFRRRRDRADPPEAGRPPRVQPRHARAAGARISAFALARPPRAG